MVSSAIKLGFKVGMTSLLFLTATTVYGLGLGNLDLQSRLNERFSAHIPIIVAEDIDASDISVKLGSKKQFKQAGLKRASSLYQLSFTPERTADGQMVITISSSSRIIEPMISFVLQVEQGGTRTLRKYTAMMDAPLKP